MIVLTPVFPSSLDSSEGAFVKKTVDLLGIKPLFIFAPLRKSHGFKFIKEFRLPLQLRGAVRLPCMFSRSDRYEMYLRIVLYIILFCFPSRRLYVVFPRTLFSFCVPRFLLSRRKIIVHVGDSSLDGYAFPPLLDMPNVVFMCVNPNIKAYLKSIYNLARVELVPNGVRKVSDSKSLMPINCSLPDRGDRKPTVLFVGHLIDRKRPDLFVEFAREYADDYDFIMVGSGEHSSFVPPFIRHIESVSGDVVISLMRQCDILIHPSEAEGMANVLLEACACNLPFIARDAEFNSWFLSKPMRALYLTNNFLPAQLNEKVRLLLSQDHSLIGIADRFSEEKRVEAIRRLIFEEFNEK